MLNPIADTQRRIDLRLRAMSQLKGHHGEAVPRASGSDALGVLFDLASSPATAHEALALLHELQVHQVELELQEEELRSSRAEMEAALRRQTELYDFAPVGLFTIDSSTLLREVNLTGARLLDTERDSLLGLRLDSFLTPIGRNALRMLLAGAREMGRSDAGALELLQHVGLPRPVQATATADPAGHGFLVALRSASAPTPIPTPTPIRPTS